MNRLALRKIPKIDLLMAEPPIKELCKHYSYSIVKDCMQCYLEELRSGILNEECSDIPSSDYIIGEILRRVDNSSYYSLKRVINATGIILHTNLGRAPLGKDAANHLAGIAEAYCNLEFNLNSGTRGNRYDHVERLLCDITGAEAAIVVNNNAGAVFLMLNTFASGKKVAVSRGELVEIGGSFRVPEIMALSGAILDEVGTTNKTHLYDYEKALENGAEILLKVHKSNYRILGFTESVGLRELSALGHERGAITMYDIGSSFLFPTEVLGLPENEYLSRSMVRDGPDLISFSGDKLLGSAQAGIIIGKKKYVEQIRENQLLRMLRIDKLSLAALEYTLKNSLSPEQARQNIPVLSMLTMGESECRAAAGALEKAMRLRLPSIEASVIPVSDEAGGGSFPGVVFPGFGVSVRLPGIEAEALETLLRKRSVPIVARINRECILFSVRTLREGDIDEIAEALADIANSRGMNG